MAAPASLNLQKCCRICWNTRHWGEPSGEAAEMEAPGSYVHDRGFGVEEWLFNFAWVQSAAGKYKYGYLQPIGKYRRAYEGKKLDVLAYVIAPNRQRLAVAKIEDLYVPHEDELENAFREMERRGWLQDMQEDLQALGVNYDPHKVPISETINVRFKQENVTFFDPWSVIPNDHVVYRSNRYQPLNWDGRISSLTSNARPTRVRSKESKLRSEDERTRAAMKGVTYSPRHVRLQNALFDHLCKVHGRTSVHYERDFVDITVTDEGETIFIEIKMAGRATGCIREAIGQLLEYGFYPTRGKASRLVVVGEAEPTPDDRTYLDYLRTTFGLPLYYRQWKSPLLLPEV